MCSFKFITNNISVLRCESVEVKNTADVSTLLPVVRKLQGRFDISRTTLVADSGMLSKANVAALQELNCDYLLAARLGGIADDKLSS